MKKLILSFALLILLSGNANAGFTLSTSNPDGSPLLMTSDTTSDLMSVIVSSDNPFQDVMSAWNFQLEIVGNSSSTGTLTFNNPVTGTPPNPSNYVFGADGIGIFAINGGTVLSANDFFNPINGAGVSGIVSANLLQMNFLASSDASGVFGIYADQGAATTQWTDGNFTTQFFSNVPDGTGMVLIGEVEVSPNGIIQVIPAPPSIASFGIGFVILAGWLRWRREKQVAV
jgi:hypothetical protein